MGDLVVGLSCPCRPGFMYKTDASLKAHRRTKGHTTWEALQENKNDKVRSKEFENEIERLKRRLAQKEDVEASLLARIHQLEEDVEYWRLTSEGVYL